MSGIPAGYKQTEVGVIPEDWSCNTVDQLVNDSILAKPLDGNHGNIHPKSGDFVSHGIPFVMANNVRDGCVDLTNCAFIRKEQADSLQKGFSLPGDVLLTHKATIGQTAIVGDVPYEYIMLTPQVTYYRVIDGERLNNEYLRQYFEGANFQRVLQSLSGGGTRSYIGITAQRELPVVVPSSVLEQRAIAAALSDVDALLAKLDQLIAKKRDLKQAAMQQLLTGQTRLPGFSGAWEETTFDSVVRHHSGNSTLIKGKLLSVETTGAFPAYSASGQDVWCDHYEYEGTAIIVSAVGSRCGKAFQATDKWCAIANTHVVWPISAKIDMNFLGFYINDEEFWLKSGSGQPFVLFKQTFARRLLLPNIEEQTAIATALSDMDAELAALEARRDKTRALKQGMLQELLTGRIRLV